MQLLKQFFTWWNSQTWGTRFFTWRKGEYVGSDAAGNRYYRAKSLVPQSIAEHRWVIYSGPVEASAIPPGWHGWMHHRVSEPPTGHEAARPWMKPHHPNLTGTEQAYRPPGSLLNPDPVKEDAPDYRPWRPN